MTSNTIIRFTCWYNGNLSNFGFVSTVIFEDVTFSTTNPLSDGVWEIVYSTDNQVDDLVYNYSTELNAYRIWNTQTNNAITFELDFYDIINLLPTAAPTISPTTDPSADPTSDPTIDPTADPTTSSPTTNPTTASPTTYPTTSLPTTSPTKEIISGIWYDDFVYVDPDAVTDFASDNIYDDGWYVLCCKMTPAFSRKCLHFHCR